MSHVHNHMREQSNREFQKDQVQRNYEPQIRLQTENDRSHYQVHNFDHIYGAISPTAASALGNTGAKNDIANLQTADFEQRNHPVHEAYTFSPN